MSEWEILEIKRHLRLSNFEDWFLTKDKYREFIINKILNE